MKSFLLSSLIFIGTLKAQGPQQLVPPVAPPPPPSNPNTVNPGNAGNPGNPAAPVDPLPPAQVTSQQPPATPQYGTPQQYNPNQQPAPYNPYMNSYGGFMPQVDPQNLNCERGQCRNRRIILSPGQGFNLECQEPMQCDGLDLTLNVGNDPANMGSSVNEINDLNFDVPTNGVTVRINSVLGNNIEVNNVRCNVFRACNNLKIIAGYGVETQNMNVRCEQPGACNGCTVNGIPCQTISVMNGNNNGYMGYGGYVNTPNVPQYGPQYGQPQQPQYPGAPQQPQGPPQRQPQYTGPQQGVPPMPQQGAPQYPQFQPYPQWI